MKNLYFLSVIALLYSCQFTTKKPDPPEAKVAAFNATPVMPPLSAEEQKKYHDLVAGYLDNMMQSKRFNGGVLVAKNGVVVYEKYVGFKNLRLKDTLDAHTPFQIASTSKTLTSAAVLQLIQQGKLNLSTPVSQIFPSFPYPDITVKMLLTQRSGLPEYLYFFEKQGWNRTTYATNNDVVNALSSWPLGRAFRADTHFDYCNTNFVLLASIVEKVSGQPFPQYMKENIFEPLKMYDTYVATVNDTARSAHSFNWDGSMWANDFSDGTYGDKNVYSTPRDLLKWDQALYTDQLINKQLLDSAFTPYSNETRSQHNYGLGWRLMIFPNGKKVVYHNGRWHGFNSAFARLTDEKVTIIMLNNKFNKGVYQTARNMYNLFGNYDTKNVRDLE